MWRIVKAAGGRGCGRCGAWGGGCLGRRVPGAVVPGPWCLGRGCARRAPCGCGSCRGARAAPASVESWELDPWAACRRGPRGRTLLGLRWFRADPRHHTAHDHSHLARLSRGVPAPRFCCRSWRLGDGRTVSGASPYGRGVRSGAMGLQRCGTRCASIGRLPPPSGREVGPARRPLVRPAVWRRLVGGGMGDFGRALRRVGEVSRTGLAPGPGSAERRARPALSLRSGTCRPVLGLRDRRFGSVCLGLPARGGRSGRWVTGLAVRAQCRPCGRSRRRTPCGT